MRILFETAGDDQSQSRRRGSRQLRRIVFQHCVHCFHGRIAAEWLRSADHLVENNPQAEEVGAMVRHLSANLLRRHVGNGPQDHARLRGRRQYRSSSFRRTCGNNLPSQAEIENLHPPVASDHHVLRLQVTMDEAGSVRGGEAIGNLRAKIGNAASGQGTLLNERSK